MAINLVYVAPTGEIGCQGYPPVPAQREIDDDSRDLEQT